jgi:hypothetical protein
VLLVVFLLVVINGYSINGFGNYFINGCWWLLMVILLVAISGNSIDGYWWLFY